MKTAATHIIKEGSNPGTLRFTTAGSVDDGKSTLIGRLLYDSRSIPDDQYESLKAGSRKRGDDNINLALLTDGLRAEREQGITIDVAYRYFNTEKRKFIIADAPGHVQYTRNMVTAASTSDLAVILIDATKGVTEQTKRHTYISSLLNITNIIVCVNKMDLIGYSREKFETIKKDYANFSKGLNHLNIQYIPVSALNGDNIVNASMNMKWYDLPTLLTMLEDINLQIDQKEKDFRFPVQYVIRPMRNDLQNYRGYAGRIVGGKINKGDKVTILPGGQHTKIKSIDIGTDPVDEASDRMSICLTLIDEIDVSRGDMIVAYQKEIRMSQDIDLMVCWLSDKKLQLNGKYILKHTTKEVRCSIKSIEYKVNINTLDKDEKDKTIGLNDIARISIKTSSILTFDDYHKNKETGSLILIDESTFVTVGAGMII